MSINYMRQFEVFNNEDFNTPIHIIGAGATGSWLALMLAKMGIKDISVYDFDVVESHNIPNQLFSPQTVGMKKVDALAITVRLLAGVEIKAYDKKVTRNHKFEGVVFMLTDTMFSRKTIYEALKKQPIQLLVETRMSSDGGYVFALNPQREEEAAKYDKSFETDEEAATSACGASTSIASTAIYISSQAVWQFINWSNVYMESGMYASDLKVSGVYNEKY